MGPLLQSLTHRRGDVAAQQKARGTVEEESRDKEHLGYGVWLVSQLARCDPIPVVYVIEMLFMSS